MMNAQLQQAYDAAVNMLRLGDVDIRVGISSTLQQRENCIGQVTQWSYDDPFQFPNYYVIELQAGQSWPVMTLAHELHHVWEYENDHPASEYHCDAFGIRVEGAIGAEPRCSLCHRVMGHLEAEESEQGIEFMDELICDKCFKTTVEV